jgi:hypothetical protein
VVDDDEQRFDPKLLFLDMESFGGAPWLLENAPLNSILIAVSYKPTAVGSR